jgi:hypothetical protein
MKNVCSRLEGAGIRRGSGCRELFRISKRGLEFRDGDPDFGLGFGISRRQLESWNGGWYFQAALGISESRLVFPSGVPHFYAAFRNSKRRSVFLNRVPYFQTPFRNTEWESDARKRYEEMARRARQAGRRGFYETAVGS